MADGHGTSRGGFLKQAAGAAVVVAGAGAGAGALAQPAGAAAAATGPKGHPKYLELDGVNLGRLYDSFGGDAGFDVVVGDIDQDGFPDKTLGAPRWTEFTVILGSNMDPAAYKWVKDALDHGLNAKKVRGGGIRFTDDVGTVRLRAFTNPRITSVTMPPLVQGKQSFPGIAVTFAVDDVTDGTPSGNTGPAYKQWYPRNFRVEIPGLGGRVASIDSFTWRVLQRPNGLPPVIDTPTLNLTVVDDGSWQAWYDKYALNGDQSDTRDGTVTVMQKEIHRPATPLVTWGFRKLRIFTLEPDFDLPSQLRVGMCCDYCTWDVP